jgi:2-polyprenyl-3-methyl-5-hydroxy-6-metoxy-1,4-benzoquinol methylase
MGYYKVGTEKKKGTINEVMLFLLRAQRKRQISFSLYALNRWGTVYSDMKKNIPHIFTFISKYIHQNYTVADLGCNDGTLTEYLSSICKRAVGCDLEQVIEKNILPKKDNLHFVGLDLEEQFPDERFDAIVALDVVEHIFNDFQLMYTCYKHLNNDGIFIVSVPLHEPHKSIHFRGYTKEKIEHILTLLEFKIVEEYEYTDTAGKQLTLVGRK